MDSQAERLIFHTDLQVEIVRAPLPDLGPRQVLIRVTRSHVSAGSEMNFFRLNPPDGPVKSRPLGYMTVGRVIAIGDAVTEYASGDRVLTCGSHGSHWLSS